MTKKQLPTIISDAENHINLSKALLFTKAPKIGSEIKDLISLASLPLIVDWQTYDIAVSMFNVPRRWPMILTLGGNCMYQSLSTERDSNEEQ
jgi:hypothetical protein